METKLIERFATGKKSGKFDHNVAARNQVNLIRYADDFIITGRTKELLENEVKPLVEAFLKERGLTLSEEKTKVTHIEEGFDFLGWNIRKYDGILLTKPSKKNVKAFLGKIREVVKANDMAKQENLIGLLNPMIRGWANYHQGAVAKETFAKVDHEIWRIIWKWATRRHPNKGTKWVKDRYFIRIGSRDWIFVATTKDKDGKPQRRTLIKASDTKIMRHIKIKGEANPFDPAQESYFESRLGWKMDNNLKGKTKLLRLWWRQDKECPHCQEKITKETGWNIHHILPKAQGGKDNISNLMLLHPNCHRQIHSQKLEVVKPAPVKGGLDEA